MDAPNGHSSIKAMSAHSPRVARFTIAVLVNCKPEPQYFPNLDVAKSAAAAPTWRGHQAQSVDGSGNVHSKIPVSKAAKMVQPSNYTGPNVALEALFHMWDSFHTSKTMWRPNPEMRQGDAPEGCIRRLHSGIFGGTAQQAMACPLSATYSTSEPQGAPCSSPCGQGRVS